MEHTCPSCQIRLRVPDESAGKKVRCKCGAVSMVATAVQATAAPADKPAAHSEAPKAASGSAAGQSIMLTCSSCQQTLRAPPSAAGKAVRCKCGQIVQVPNSATAAVARAASAASPAAARPIAAAQAATLTRPTAAKSSQPAVAARAVRSQASAPSHTATSPSTAGTASLFDELTDADWQRESPIKRAYAPPPVSKDGAFLKQYIGKETATSSTSHGAIPGALIALSVLNFIGSVFYILAGVAIVALVQVDELMQTLETVFPPIRVAATLFCAYFIAWGIYLSVVGVGLLQRAPWGWCVAGVSYAHAAVDRCYYVIDAFIEGMPPGKIIGTIGGVLVLFGIVSYIYKAETRKHFGVKSMTPVIICAVIGVLLAILTIVAIALFVNAAEAAIPADIEAVEPMIPEDGEGE